MFLEGYWDEFCILAVINTMGLISPGPDFAIEVRNTLSFGRRIGIATALGIGCGLAVHISYCLFGIAWVIQQSTALFQGIQVLGAFYLLFLGIKGLFSQGKEDLLNPTAKQSLSFFQGWRQGFLTNVLNPKCTLFVLSIFTSLIDPQTPRWVQGIYGAFMILSTWIWFSFLAMILSSQKVLSKLRIVQQWVEKGISLMLCGLGIAVLWTVFSSI